ncbi:PIG-L family deacetylase [Desulfosarcina sp.]|nr:PIG-L family deacetylase [Desulfosarcina sp.]
MSKKVMVIVAHPDDEVLGCGATIARHSDQGDDLALLVMADGETSRNTVDWNKETRDEGLYAAAKILGIKEVYVENYPDQKMDTIAILDIVRSIENKINKWRPSVIYTHHGGDLNLDHRITHQAVMTACRPQPDSLIDAIYTFEVLSSTEWASSVDTQFRPTRACDISKYLDIKLVALECYHKELREFPHPRSYEAVMHLAKIRGAQYGVEAAEVFFIERELWR